MNTTDDKIFLTMNYAAIAKEFLKRQKAMIRFWRGDWYTYNGRHYIDRNKMEMEAAIMRFLNMCHIKTENKEMQFPTSTKIVNEVKHQVMGHKTVLLSTDRDERTGANGESLDHLIPCRNGLLDIYTGEMLPHSPDNFFLNSLAFDYHPNEAVGEPVEWMRFLLSLWPDDQAAIDLLQEFMGYIISGDASFQKIFLLIGPARSGKGTIARIIRKLMGDDQCGGVNVDAFSSNFGMQKMIGKTVVFMPDQRNHARGMTGSMTERLLTISGQDKITVDRKHKDHWEGVLSSRIVILSNDIPQVPDASGVIATRFVPLVFEQCFLGREDMAIEDRLTRELPQILKWAITGLKRLRAREQFVLTPSGQEMIDKIQQAAAPHLEFFAETFEEDLAGMCSKDDAFDKYKDFCEQRRHIACSHTIFCNRVKVAYPKIKDTRPNVGGKRVQMWQGLRFKPDEAQSQPQGYIDVTAQLTMLLHKAHVLKAVGQQIDPDEQAMLDKVKALLAE